MTSLPHESPSSALSGAEAQRRIVFAMLRPAVRLCRLFRLPLGVVEELCRMAYFEEVRFRGHHSQAETALWMGKSLRTIGSLERLYRSDFLAPETELTLMRDVEDFFGQGPATLDDLAKSLSSVDRVALERVVVGLVALGRLTVQGDDDETQSYALDHGYVSLVKDDVTGQLDGLKHQLDVIVSAVTSRFFNRERFAMARTLSFLARDEDVEALGDAIVRTLRTQCIDAEERALKDNTRTQYAVTFALSPTQRNDDPVEPNP